MERVAIVGAAGSGKSMLATRLASRLGAPEIDLDALYHRPNWEPTPTAEFRITVAEALRVERWVVAGNYSMVSDIVHGAADTIVWLDLPRWLSTQRVARRSLGRVIKRTELWGGNRERWRTLVSRDPEVNIILWSWQSHPKLTGRYAGFADGEFWDHADVVRLRSPREVRAFLSTAC